MDTKLKGDIAEQAVVLYALKQGWGVLKPIEIDYLMTSFLRLMAIF